MKSIQFRVLLAVAFLWAAGCEVTQEKIDLWKGTKNGPKKLAGAAIDPEVPIGLRAAALVALVEINDWELFKEVFAKIDQADASRLIEAVVPILRKMTESGGAGKAILREQVDAKDALFILLDFASGPGKEAADRALVDWCVQDFNNRAMAGQYGIRAIVTKLGPAGAAGIIPLLAVDQLVIGHVAELIREVNDGPALAKASEKLADELKSHVDKLTETHLAAASTIGGAAVAGALLDLATNKSLSDELQRLALRALSVGLDKGTVALDGAAIDRLFAMAESDEYDKYQREETYYVIAQAGRKEDLPRIRKLFPSKSAFWRAVGLRCALRIDGEGQLGAFLKEIGDLNLTRTASDVQDVVGWVAAFPKLLAKVRELVGDGPVFSRAVALGVLAKIGTAADADRIDKLLKNGDKLPKGFEYKTLGDAAKAALEAIRKRG